MIDLLLWITCFLPRLLVQLFKKKKYVGTSTTVSSTVNNVRYTTVCTCNQCGYTWKNNA